MEDKPLRRDFARQRPRRLRYSSRLDELFFQVAIILGFALGLAVTLLREEVLPDQFNRDANRIYNIASGRVPDFTDRSYTPVGIVYRWIGLGDAPTAAAIVGYLAASAVILVALFRTGRRTASLPVALYIVSAFLLSSIYLGQYSKDVFVLIPVVLLISLPRRILWDVVGVGAMLLYAYFFRDYWAIVAFAYAAYRLITLWQARIRYLLAGGAFASVAVGMAFFVALGVDPNHYRTVVQGHLNANTLIVPLEPAAQPLGGAVDVFVNYWLLYLPVLLPFTASIAYIVVMLGIGFAKLFPLMAARSEVRWPSRSVLDGSLARRALSLILAVGVVQAVFEPDYGSALRHFTPLMPLALVLMQSLRSGRLRAGRAPAWNWSGDSTRDVEASTIGPR
ncbi:hypothetical protein N8K70_13345 [Microbacterium betulae]|uniref:Uncharacterized protein n=1 Tax=Microbacterium betulae TaxID=2981139 RepID=A0AA97I522_9MICO|nr:hypothetical protein [Microbacterium sp. AB]WOF22364.1 hypothetical protein N8K70_13345 [Microbacterium sp. AB]